MGSLTTRDGEISRDPGPRTAGRVWRVNLRIALAVGALAALAGAAPPPAETTTAAPRIVAQALPVLPIGKVLEDRDGDTIPDRIDQKVRVRGVVVVDSDTFSDEYFQVTIADSTGGVNLYNRKHSLNLAIGTEVEATGKVSEYHGAVQLSHADIKVLGQVEPAEPAVLTVGQAASWKWFGRVVKLEGTLGKLDLGTTTEIPLTGDDGKTIDLYFPQQIGRVFQFSDFPSGSRVVATGVVTIYKPTVPYDSGWELLIRGAGGLSVESPPPPQWRRRVAGWFAAVLIVIVSTTAMILLLRKRRLERERELRVLNRVSSILASASPRLDELLELSVATFVEQDLADAASIHLFEPDRSLVLRATSGFGRAVADRLDSEDVVQDLAAAVVRRDARLDDWSGSDAFHRLAGEMGLGEASVLPLRGRNGLVGVLTLFGPPGSGSSREVSRLIDSSANLVALGIENLLMARQSEEDREELKQLAITDDLTGLYNRRFLEEYLRIQTAMTRRRGASMAFLVVDIDHFKRVNDTWGHEAGDRALVRAAELIRGVVRASDLPVRYGGEEFLIVMPDGTRDGVLAFAERLRSNFEEMEIDGPAGSEPIRLTISIGIAFYPDHGDRVREVLRTADEAVYRSKREGRNRVTVAE